MPETSSGLVIGEKPPTKPPSHTTRRVLLSVIGSLAAMGAILLTVRSLSVHRPSPADPVPSTTVAPSGKPRGEPNPAPTVPSAVPTPVVPPPAPVAVENPVAPPPAPSSSHRHARHARPKEADPCAAPTYTVAVSVAKADGTKVKDPRCLVDGNDIGVAPCRVAIPRNQSRTVQIVGRVYRSKPRVLDCASAASVSLALESY